MPSLSGSAFHRRRSVRQQNAVHSTTASDLKDNFPPVYPPPSVPAPAAPVVRSNASPSPPATWRSQPPSPFSTASSPHGALDVHAMRVMYAVLSSSIFGSSLLYIFTSIYRLFTTASFSSGIYMFLAYSCVAILVCCVLMFFLGSTERVFATNSSNIPYPYVNQIKALRYVSSNRVRLIHVISSGCISAALLTCTSFCMGFIHHSHLNSGLYSIWVGFFIGMAHSYLAQISSFYTWRYSPTRETVIRRARADIPFSLALSSAAVCMGFIVSWVDLLLGGLVMSSFGLISSRTAFFYVGPLTHFTAIIAAFISTNTMTLVSSVYMHMMTVPINVRDYVSDSPVPATSIHFKNNEDRALAAVSRILDDISCRTSQHGLEPLARLLGLQFFRDVARTSRNGRRILFADLNGERWNPLLEGCIEPIKDFTVELASKVKSIPKDNLPATSGNGNGRLVAFACEILSHMLVASREEDDFGIVQRTFVHVIMCLLALKEHVDSEKQRLRFQKSSVLKLVPQSAYFDEENMTNIVGDSVELALVRICDSFRTHLEGFLEGREPHWDRRYDTALRSALSHVNY